MNCRTIPLAAVLLLAACDRNSGGDAAAPPPTAQLQVAGRTVSVDRSHAGKPLPQFTFSDPAGKLLSTGSLKGKPTLINLWATWCGPCVAEMPTLDKLADDQEIALRVVTISQDAPGAQVTEFISSHGYKHLEPWLDPEGRIDSYYNTGHFPTTVYYDADGREVWRYVGSRDWGDEDTPGLLIEGIIK